MLQNEFEERTKLSITAYEFNGINALYMACGDGIDKDVFCKLYMSFEGRLELLHMIEREHQRMKDALDEHKLLLKECREIVSDAADAMLEIENGLLDGETVEHTTREVFAAELLDRKAWWLVGPKEVVLRKIKIGMTLTEKDLNYISENLK